MKKIIFIFTMAIVIGAVSSVGIAFQGQGNPGGHGDAQMQIPLHRWWKHPKALEQFNITPAETKKLDTFYQKVREQLIDSQALLQKDMLRLEMQFDSDTFDQSKCLKLFKEAQTTRTKLATEKFEFVLKTREILGKERFEELLKTFEQLKRHAVRREMQQRQTKMPMDKTQKEL